MVTEAERRQITTLSQLRQANIQRQQIAQEQTRQQAQQAVAQAEYDKWMKAIQLAKKIKKEAPFATWGATTEEKARARLLLQKNEDYSEVPEYMKEYARGTIEGARKWERRAIPTERYEYTTAEGLKIVGTKEFIEKKIAQEPQFKGTITTIPAQKLAPITIVDTYQKAGIPFIKGIPAEKLGITFGQTIRKEPTFSIWQAGTWAASKVEKVLPKSWIKASAEYEVAHPTTSKVIRTVFKFGERVAPFVAFAPVLATGATGGAVVKPIKPAKPVIVKDYTRIIRGKLKATKITRVPKTYVRVEGALGMAQRVQVSPTIRVIQTTKAPITLRETKDLIIRGAIRTQRVLPKTTKFVGFKGYDVSTKMFVETIKPAGTTAWGVRGKVTQITLPTKPMIRTEAKEVFVRTAGRFAGIKYTFEKAKTGLKLKQIVIPKPTTKVVVAKQVPIAEVGYIKGKPAYVALRQEREITTIWGKAVQTRYAQRAIQIKPTVAKVEAGRLDIFKRIKPEVEAFRIIKPAPTKIAPSISPAQITVQAQKMEQLATVKFPKVPVPSLKVVETSPVQVTKSVLATTTTQKERLAQIQQPVQIQPPIQEIMQVEKLVSPTAQIPRVVPLEVTKVSPAQIVAPVQLQAPILQSVQVTPTVLTFPKPRVTPIITPPVKAPLIRKVPSRLISKARALLGKGYKTFIYRGGKKQYLSGVAPRGEAIRKGEARVLRTIAAKFGIEKTRIPVRERLLSYKPSERIFRRYKIKGKKKIPLEDEWIQKAGTKREPTIKGARLAARSEVRELLSFRRKKR